jgi:hypothetical protein
MNIELTFAGTKNWSEMFRRLLSRELQQLTHIIERRILVAAREDHRYRRLTGDLRSATVLEGDLSKGPINLRVDLGVAEYGEDIIMGFGSWSPDPFIDEAIQNNLSWIDGQVKGAIDRSVQGFNRSE